MKKNSYVYDDREFHSIRELAEYTGMNEKTITARLRRGMTIEEACRQEDFRCACYEEGGRSQSISQICRDQSKDEWLVRNRLKYGYTMDDALHKPKKVTKQGTPIVVDGVLYQSIASALRQFHMTEKESTVRRRLKEGMEPDKAFFLPIGAGHWEMMNENWRKAHGKV